MFSGTLSRHRFRDSAPYLAPERESGPLLAEIDHAPVPKRLDGVACVLDVQMGPFAYGRDRSGRFALSRPQKSIDAPHAGRSGPAGFLAAVALHAGQAAILFGDPDSFGSFFAHARPVKAAVECGPDPAAQGTGAAGLGSTQARRPHSSDNSFCGGRFRNRYSLPCVATRANCPTLPSGVSKGAEYPPLCRSCSSTASTYEYVGDFASNAGGE